MYDHSQVIYSLLWETKSGFLFLDNLSALLWGNCKIYCTASSFHKIFNLVHNELHDEVNSYTSKICKVHNVLLNLL